MKEWSALGDMDTFPSFARRQRFPLACWEVLLQAVRGGMASGGVGGVAASGRVKMIGQRDGLRAGALVESE